MKALLGVVLIAFVVQASAQNNPSLRCFECADCRTVERGTTLLVDCYTQSTPPTRRTDPPTIGLTPTGTTTTGLPTPSTVAPTTTPAPAEGFVDVSAARAGQIFTCFTIQSDIGPRRVTSRGCGVISATKEQTCNYHNQNEEPAACNLCDEHECNNVNGVTKVFGSISLIFAALFIALRLH